MDPMLIEYLVFFAAVFIIIWAALAFNKRLYRHNAADQQPFKNWVELDTKHPGAREELEQKPSVDEDENEDRAKLYIRAHQNGHHVESQQPPL
ncbi:MAG: hypothetical protein ACRDHZ_22000 [Ktedonobacteraceae bacterium]